MFTKKRQSRQRDVFIEKLQSYNCKKIEDNRIIDKKQSFLPENEYPKLQICPIAVHWLLSVL